MYEKIVDMLAEYLAVDKSKITRETDIRKDLGADSLVLMEMIFVLENETGIIISDEDAKNLSVVGALADHLEKHAKK